MTCCDLLDWLESSCCPEPDIPAVQFITGQLIGNLQTRVQAYFHCLSQVLTSQSTSK